MDSVEGTRGLEEAKRFRRRLNRSYALDRITTEDYFKLHKLITAIIVQLQEMRNRVEV